MDFFLQNWDEIESLKNEKNPGKVLEFCFPINPETPKQTLRQTVNI